MLLDPRLEALHFAVRLRVIAKFVGQMLLPLAVLTCVPAAVALVSGNHEIAARYAVVILALALLGFLGARLECTPRIQTNEALVVSALMFIISALAMAFPMMGYDIAFTDAVFETVSAVTTTGLSTLHSVEDKPAAFLFARAWMQWVGGLGVVVLALAMLITPGIAAQRMGFDRREAEDVAGGTRAHARRVMIVYGVMTASGVSLLWILGATPLDAVVHALAAVSTGGFSNYDASLDGFDSWALRWGVSGLCLLGALSFSWYYSGFYKKLGSLLRDRDFQTLLLLCGLATGALFLLTPADPGSEWTSRFAHAGVMALSAQTTAGFSSLPAAEMSAASKLVLIASMAIGGDLGSTAGGLKILRLLVLARLLKLIIARASVPPRSHVPLRLREGRLHEDELQSILAVVCAYLCVIFLSWFVFLAHGHAPLESLFDVVSAVGTAGISAGVVGPNLEPVLKGVLCVAMLMGRLEVIAILVLLLPATWIGKRRSAK